MHTKLLSAACRPERNGVGGAGKHLKCRRCSKTSDAEGRRCKPAGSSQRDSAEFVQLSKSKLTNPTCLSTFSPQQRSTEVAKKMLA